MDNICDRLTQLMNQSEATEVIVERCKPLRFAAENHRMAEMVGMINSMEH